ncbi:MAG TPA: Rne/Rng family ribonuclease [Tissierellaceae bacterium]|nr:Rne/Rng family ribonuclease [Tissierellaceae bacterium]
MNYIFIDSNNGINKIGIVEDRRLVEYYTEKEEENKLVGNIYRGRVENVFRGLNAAFVNIGEEKNGYLYIKDVLSREKILSPKRYNINDLLKSGEDIIVQVIKESFGDKGPKISKDISIPGRYIVLTPYSEKINISRRIKGKKEINRLKSIGEDIKEDNHGLIFRTLSEEVDKETLEEEYKTLIKIYKNIEERRNFLPTPKLLYRELDLIYKIVRDNFNQKDYRIITNNKKVYENLLEMDEYFSYGLKEKTTLDPDFSAKYNGNIQSDIDKAFNRKVNLKSGGYIVIDETEALTAIDVNTGKYVGSQSLSKTVLNTNLEAIKEIARQIRLRDIGGIIIIDFIDMRNKIHVSKLIRNLKREFKNDRNKPIVVDITKLGLVEVTRKRVRPTLDSTTTTECPTCHGVGRIQK